MQIREIISHLESVAPPALQESYDNAGLIVGEASAEVRGALLCLDTIEEVVDEAVLLGCNLVIAHHPIVFKGLKKLNGSNYVERAVIKAIRNDVAIYAVHTNLDNVYRQGVNAKIAGRLGLRNTRILAPKKELKKVSVFVAPAAAAAVRSALFQAGAGSVNGFDRVSFAGLGAGTSAGEEAAVFKLEAVFPSWRQGAVLAALGAHAQGAHFEVVNLENANLETGAGLIGELAKPVKESEFLKNLKTVLRAGCVRHTRLLGKPIRTVALCGGAGSFLLPNALAQGADVFVSADFKYHEFFDADGRILIADIGHYESEQFTMELLQEIIAEKFPTFATHLTKVVTNPVHYL
jgi:dinuclear metal center YbgI/SA1388 family protein